MKTLRFSLLGTLLIVLLCFNQKSFANNATYEARREAYIDTSLASPVGKKLILQAYRGLPLDTTELNDILNQIPTRSTSDFIIIELIRVLFLTNGTYDAKILPVLNGVPYWMNYSDTLRGYWSENHMIMWMSSDWLLHEKYNKPIDSNLRNRLVHYLEMKIKYGFYEFFSTTYAPYTFSGLLNLADFSQDVQIKNLAIQASQKLLSEILLLTNDKGIFFPVAGRNFAGRYIEPYKQNAYNLIYLLTGFGEAPQGASASGPFLATSTLPVDTVINSWKAEVDMVYSIGHSLDSGFVLNSNMSATDKIVFQWSSGAYFHPAVVFETVSLLADSNLWNHVDFTLLKPFSFLPANDFPAITENLNVISKSTLICGQDVAIFKHHAVTLSSVLDFWKGKVGFQQYPSMANVGSSAVYTWSGQVRPDLNNRNNNNQNIHLPYVAQQKNVSLIMYRPEPTFEVFGSAFTHKDVALQWEDAKFDEIVEDSLWLIGREENGYVAVRRNCIGEINSIRACPTPVNGGQTWVIVVGDSLMYGSFNNFQNAIQQSTFVETWSYDTLSSQSIYYAKIDFDTISIDYAWSRDSSLNTSIENVSRNNVPFTVYPNPADKILNVDVAAFSSETIYIKAFNAVGEVVYAEKILVTNGNDIKTINTSNWSQGIYMIVIENNNNRYSRKIIKTE
jgi:hypothetical protein